MDAGNTKISIINKSLSHIKVQTITALTDQSEPARKANLFYDCARKSLLRECDWQWARVKKQLNLIGSIEDAIAYPTDISKQDIIRPWIYTYGYPAECVRLHKLFNPEMPGISIPFYLPHSNDGSDLDNVTKYEIGRSPITNIIAIGVNMQNAWAEFTYNITDESQFDDMFQDALAWVLAAELAMPLCCDKELAQMVDARAKESVSEAKRKNGGEAPEFLPRVCDYERARTIGGYGVNYPWGDDR
jgi:hypothetical protein